MEQVLNSHIRNIALVVLALLSFAFESGAATTAAKKDLAFLSRVDAFLVEEFPGFSEQKKAADAVIQSLLKEKATEEQIMQQFAELIEYDLVAKTTGVDDARKQVLQRRIADRTKFLVKESISFLEEKKAGFDGIRQPIFPDRSRRGIIRSSRRLIFSWNILGVIPVFLAGYLLTAAITGEPAPEIVLGSIVVGPLVAVSTRRIFWDYYLKIREGVSHAKVETLLTLMKSFQTQSRYCQEALEL